MPQINKIFYVTFLFAIFLVPNIANAASYSSSVFRNEYSQILTESIINTLGTSSFGGWYSFSSQETRKAGFFETWDKNQSLCEVIHGFDHDTPLPAYPYPPYELTLTVYEYSDLSTTFYASAKSSITNIPVNRAPAQRNGPNDYDQIFAFYDGAETQHHTTEPGIEDCLFLKAETEYYFEFEYTTEYPTDYLFRMNAPKNDTNDIIATIVYDPSLSEPYDILSEPAILLGYGDVPDPPATGCEFDILNPFPFILCLVIPSESVYTGAISDLSNLQLEKFGGLTDVVAAISDMIYDIEPYPLPSSLTIPYKLPFNPEEYTAEIPIPIQITDGISIARSLLGMLAIIFFALYVIRRIPEII